MWAVFESRFGSILSSLAYHRDLMDKEAAAIDVSAALEHNKQEAEKWERQEREWLAYKIKTVLSWLETKGALPQDTLQRHNDTCLPGSCDWFIKHSQTQQWLKDGAQKAPLWLTGKPGAGQHLHALHLTNTNETARQVGHLC